MNINNNNSSVSSSPGEASIDGNNDSSSVIQLVQRCAVKNHEDPNFANMIQLLCNSYNSSPYSQQACKWNLHSPVLTTQEGVLFVPYPTQHQYRSLVMSPEFITSSGVAPLSSSLSSTVVSAAVASAPTTTAVPSPNDPSCAPKSPPCTFFIGCLPLLVNEVMIQTLIRVIAGVNPIAVTISKPVKNRNRCYSSPVVFVVVNPFDEAKLVTNLHRRVIFDQTGFHVAATSNQVTMMHRYCKMLTRTKGRFQHRPYLPITVTRVSPRRSRRGKDRIFDNEYNPVCPCDDCQTILHTFTSFEHHLLGKYMAAVVTPTTTTTTTGAASSHPYHHHNNHPHHSHDVDEEGSTVAVFDWRYQILTHAFRNPENLYTQLEQRLYADVAPRRLQECTQLTLRLWPEYRSGEKLMEIEEGLMFPTSSYTTSSNEQQQQQHYSSTASTIGSHDDNKNNNANNGNDDDDDYGSQNTDSSYNHYNDGVGHDFVDESVRDGSQNGADEKMQQQRMTDSTTTDGASDIHHFHHHRSKGKLQTLPYYCKKYMEYLVEMKGKSEDDQNVES